MLVIELAVSANTRGVFFGAAVGSAGSLAPPQALCGPDQPGIKLNYTRSGARCQFGLGIWSLTSEILVRRTRLSHATNDTKVPAQWGRAEEVTVRRCRRNTAATSDAPGATAKSAGCRGLPTWTFIPPPFGSQRPAVGRIPRIPLQTSASVKPVFPRVPGTPRDAQRVGTNKGPKRIRRFGPLPSAPRGGLEPPTLRLTAACSAD